MADANYLQSSFLGGAWSKASQGRIDRPDYRTAMNVCLNGLPIDTGAWCRRPGTRFVATTRGGTPGRVITFAFQQNSPYTMEFTDNHLRFFNGASLVTANDDVAVTSISSASPALLTVAAAVTWATGDQAFFNHVTVATPLLFNRLFTLTKVSTTTFTLTDALTGANIDGSTLGTLGGSETVSRALDFATPYASGSWSAVRSVQAEKQAILLSGTMPQVLTATVDPTATAFATFTLAPANFIDGPYLDPFTNGVQITPASKTGIVSLTLAFAAYDATHAYQVGDYVTNSSVNYISLVDQNLNNTPASSPTKWATASAGSAIGQNGFSGTDVGRHVRLFSEPPLWVVGTTYAAGTAVSYVNNLGGTAYYTWTGSSTAATASNAPGLSTSWGLSPAAALWTWGKITSLSNLISGTLSGSANIGTFTDEAGLSAAFNGSTTQNAVNCAAIKNFGTITGTLVNPYIGKNYTGASDQSVALATVFPSAEYGFVALSPIGGSSGISNFVMRLRGKASAPSSPSDGTLLGQATLPDGEPYTSPVTITSSDTTTTWKYLWIEFQYFVTITGGGTWRTETFAAQVQFFSSAGTGVSSGVNLQLLGANLLYTTPVRTWRLGLFSGTSGYPTCGTYHEGRLWMSGVVGNRVDGSVPNQLFNFAPTESDGTVTDSSAIDYTFDGPDVNTIFWMEPDQQGIIIGTQAGEWLVQASSLNSPLTPTSMQAHRVTKIGCANIEPRRTEHTLVFVQKFLRKIMEYFADVYSGKFSAPNLAVTAKHLTSRNVEEIAYQQELAPVIWARCADGSLIGATYKRDSLMSSQGPTFCGWHEHTLGSGRTVESICVGPSSDGTLDTLSMVTNDSVSGVRHVELMTDLFQEEDDVENAWFLDDAVTPSYTQNVVLGGVSSFQMFGLWHLNGKTVSVFAGGLYLGTCAVASGNCSIAFGAAGGLFTTAFVASFSGSMPVVVGFAYTSRGQLVRPALPQEAGARTGPAIGKKRRTQYVSALLYATQDVKFGTSFAAARMNQAKLATEGGVALAENVLFTNTFRDSLTDDYSYDSMVCWEADGVKPCNIAAISGFVQTQDT